MKDLEMAVRNPGRCGWAVGLALLLAVGAAYSNHFHNAFHFDDAHTIVNNAFIRDLQNIPRFFVDATLFSSLPANQSYRPIISTTLAIDYWLGGKLAPFWFQVTGFVWFVGVVVLLGLVTYQLLETVRPARHNVWLALLAGAWFGLHPANADTVNYIISRSDVISTLAVIGSLALYQVWPTGRRTYLYVAPAAVGILAKPIAVVFAPLFAVYWMLFDRDTAAKRTVEPVVLVCGLMSWFVQAMTPRTWVGGATGTWEYLITQPYVILLYFQTFFWPVGLSADYDLAPFRTLHDVRVWVGFGFLSAYVVGTVLAVRGRQTRVIGFGLMWFLLALLPTSVWPLAEVMNSHRTFFAYAGLIIALAGGAAWVLGCGWEFSRRARIVTIAAVLAGLCVSGVATYQRNQVWRTEESLWRDVTLKSPENGRGLMNYGLTLMAKGDFSGALEYFYRAQRYTPGYATLFVNLGIAEAATGNLAKAERDFQTALRLAPKTPSSYTYYARWLLAQSRAAEAAPLLRQALALSPGDVFARDLLVQAEAAPATRRALPARAEAFLNLSLQHYREQRFAAAIVAAEEALKLRPDYPEAYNNLCAAYNQLGDYAKAIVAGEQALLYRPDFPLAANNLQYARQKLQGR